MIRIIPMMCHKWTCPICSKYKANYWKKLAMSGKPERFITLTIKNDGSETTMEMAGRMKRAWPKLLTEIRKTWGEFEYLLIWELTQKGAPHIHLLQRGAWVEKQWLSDRWMDLVGAPIVSIKALTSADRAAQYIMKYMGKSLGETASALPKYRVVQRSRNWVLPTSEPSATVERPEGPSFTSWVWTRRTMEELLESATRHYGFLEVPGGGPDVVTLLAPDLPDIVDILLFEDNTA